jgi:sigma-B regulation protein RsbU (phosphoserine phosphatase)
MNAPHDMQLNYDRLLYCLSSLADMGETIAGVRSIRRSAQEILHIVLGTMGASKGALLTLEGGRFYVSAARGTKTGSSFTAEKELRRELEETDARLLPRWQPEFPERLKALCNRRLADLEVVLAVVLRAQRKVVGLLLISKRFMHQEFADEDLRILDMIGRHVSVALYSFSLRRNAQSAAFQLSHKVLQLESLHDIGLSVASLKPKDELLREVLYGSISLLDARRAFYLHAERGKLSVGPRIGLTNDQIEAFVKHPTYTKKFRAGASMRLRASRAAQRALGSPTLLAAPVRTAKHLFGTLAVVGKEQKDGDAVFTVEDQKLLEAFATQAAVALRNLEMQAEIIEKERLAAELETAVAIHRRIVPSSDNLPVINGFDIHGYNYPCKEVGGDYFDVISLPEGRFAFVICDVSGKGLSAALLVSTLQATFHSLLHSDLPLVEIVERANRLLIRNTTSEKYATAFIGIADTYTGRTETINAGHNEPLLVRQSGEMEKLYAGGLILGMFDFAAYESQEIELETGDMIYLYTDGISEATDPSGEEFGDGRLEEIVRSLSRRPSQEILGEIEHRVRLWTGHYCPGEGFPHDDFTHLAIQKK